MCYKLFINIQVNRYLASYLAAGGHFPEKTAARLKKLASEVINRPGAMSPHETMVLYTRCKEFLKVSFLCYRHFLLLEAQLWLLVLVPLLTIELLRFLQGIPLPKEKSLKV